jgi:hypothetical protein
MIKSRLKYMLKSMSKYNTTQVHFNKCALTRTQHVSAQGLHVRAILLHRTCVLLDYTNEVLLRSIFFRKAGYPPTTLTAIKPFQLPLNINKQGSNSDAIPQAIIQILINDLKHRNVECLSRGAVLCEKCGQVGKINTRPTVTAFSPKRWSRRGKYVCTTRSFLLWYTGLWHRAG